MSFPARVFRVVAVVLACLLIVAAIVFFLGGDTNSGYLRLNTALLFGLLALQDF